MELSWRFGVFPISLLCSMFHQFIWIIIYQCSFGNWRSRLLCRNDLLFILLVQKVMFHTLEQLELLQHCLSRHELALRIR